MINMELCYGLLPKFELLFESANIIDVYNIENQNIELKLNMKSSEPIKVFKMLDGTKKLNDCLKSFSDETAVCVCNIIEKYFGYIFYAQAIKDADFASRHSKNFLINNSESFKFHPFQMRGILRNEISESRIILYGCGILGMEIYEQLKSIGIIDFVFADSGNVTADDIYYSNYYKDSNTDCKRIDVLKNKLGDPTTMNLSFCDEPNDNCIFDIKGKKLLAVVCTDGITKERLYELNSYFNNNNIRWVNVYVDSEKISVGPYIIPGVTSCLECFGDRNKFEFPLYYGFNYIDLSSLRLAAAVFANEIFFIIGNACEYLIKDVSLTICRQFVIKKRDLIAYQNEIGIDCSCTCHSSEGKGYG